ncbi:MAG: aminopeptidase P family protein [Rhodospirillales bacterium]|nr:aminopeptidase P family protein [Rhodospirillales bacterium]
MDSNPKTVSHALRLENLRSELRRQGLDGFLVPRADEYQGEYVPPHAERLAWLTGFTGSAGIAIVCMNEAAVFTDGRYTLQIGQEVDEDLFECLHQTETPPDTWLRRHLAEGNRIGFDPWLHTGPQLQRFRDACALMGAALIPCEANPLDAAWMDQPPPPTGAVRPHPITHAGQTSNEKRAAIAAGLTEERLNAAVLTAPDSIAWLFNIRGGDVPFTPLPLCVALISADSTAQIFIDLNKVTDGLSDHLGNSVSIHPKEDFAPALSSLGAAGQRIRIARDTCPEWVISHLKTAGADIAPGEDPCALPKARKNEVELEGMREAHRRDGVALVRFLAWLAREWLSGKITELTAAKRLEAFRAEGALFMGPSFQTISGAGANGAIVHYRVEPHTAVTLKAGSLYLVDSGGQYLDGTTDVTRTIAIGEPDGEMRDRFTRVLKGHIALATAHFPTGTSGSQLDVLARTPLWEAGLDYDHGTGHGVGCFLGVHEGPQRISKMPNRVALEPGMILSNEPGYYKEGAFGIRIENLVAVRELASAKGGERDMLEFETLTLAPIDRALIDPDLLTEAETGWLDEYHRRVNDTLAPMLEPDAREWLATATRPIRP